MNCYCFDNVVKSNNYNNMFMSFSDVNSTETRQICYPWYQSYFQQTSLEYGIPVLLVFINMVACTVFEALGPFGKFYSVSDQT